MGKLLSSIEEKHAIQRGNDALAHSFLKYIGRSNSLVLKGNDKTYKDCFIKPILLNLDHSFVCIDKDGELMKSTGYYLEKKAKFKVQCLNLQNPDLSNHYNPLTYIEYGAKNKHSSLTQELDIFFCPFKDNITSIPFLIYQDIYQIFDWQIKTIKLFEYFCESFVRHEPEENRNLHYFHTILQQYIDSYKNNTLIDGESEFERRATFACKDVKNSYYDYFKSLKPKIRFHSVNDFVNATRCFEKPEFVKLTGSNDIDIPSFLDQKTALFIIPSNTDKDLNSLINLFLNQMERVLDLASIIDNGTPAKLYNGEWGAKPEPVICDGPDGRQKFDEYPFPRKDKPPVTVILDNEDLFDVCPAEAKRPPMKTISIYKDYNSYSYKPLTRSARHLDVNSFSDTFIFDKVGMDSVDEMLHFDPKKNPSTKLYGREINGIEAFNDKQKQIRSDSTKILNYRPGTEYLLPRLDLSKEDQYRYLAEAPHGKSYEFKP